ncbi:MAG: alpha/beta fold hydrolase [Bacteroidota bacterium]
MAKINRKKWIRVLFGLATIGLLLLHFYVPRFITDLRNPIVGLIRTAPVIGAERQFPGADLTIQSTDGLKLVGQLQRTAVDSVKGCIILVHGIGSCKEYFKALATRINDWGYHALAIDQRAHGESQGRHCTFGAKEKQDIAAWVDYLKTQENIQAPIGIWGQSLGGAVALQSLGSNPALEFGIIESTFSNYQEVVHDYFAYHAGVHWRPFSNYLSGRAGRIAGFDAKTNNPIDDAQQIQQPVLIVHGTADQRISIDYGRANFEVIPSTQKQFLAIENANHLNVWAVGGETYFEQVRAFLDKE